MDSTADLVHVWHQCHGCGARPIRGRRYHCEGCPAGPDNDLCAPCYDAYHEGRLAHPSPGTMAPAGTEHRFTATDGKPLADFAPWLAVPFPPRPAPPSVPTGAVVRPEFCAGCESFIGAHGLIVDAGAPHGVLLLTALHVMDELCKKKGVDASVANAGYTGRELPALVTRVNLYDVFAQPWILADLGAAGPMLTLPDARADDEEPYSCRDVAAFKVHAPVRLQPLPLAAAPPAVGEPVWLALQVSPTSQDRALEAVVVEVTERTFVFRFRGDYAGPRFSSGAPLLDARGAVAGVNVGRGHVGDATVGHGSHAGSIRRHLASA